MIGKMQSKPPTHSENFSKIKLLVTVPNGTQGEILGFPSYTINTNAMKRYARRRNKLKELETRIQNFGKN